MLSQRRLTDLARIDRSLHGRWIGKRFRLLPGRKGREPYGRRDLQLAAALGSLWASAGDRRAASAWRQIRSELDVLGEYLVVFVNLATEEAGIARSPLELGEQLPRADPVLVVDLATPAREADERLRRFELATQASDSQASAVSKNQRRKSA
jgi:hypothetical protein